MNKLVLELGQEDVLSGKVSRFTDHEIFHLETFFEPCPYLTLVIRKKAPTRLGITLSSSSGFGLTGLAWVQCIAH